MFTFNIHVSNLLDSFLIKLKNANYSFVIINSDDQIPLLSVSVAISEGVKLNFIL
jgi:hypothetical protein